MDFLRSANSLMGKTIYEQRELEAEAKVEDEAIVSEENIDEMGIEKAIEVAVNGDEEGGLEGDIEDMEELEGGEEGEEEMEMISVEDAKEAIQLVIDGEAETAEEALAMVGSEEAEEGGEEELEGGEEGEEPELEEEEVEIEIDAGEEEVEEGCGKKPMEAEEVEIEIETGEEEKEENYGESHSMFLKFSQKYL